MARFDPLRRDIAGGQAYQLDVPGTARASALSVSFKATEKMGVPTEVRIELTHPTQLPRTDYLNLDAVFSVVAEDVAGKGTVEFQAQDGPMSFIADKDAIVASGNGTVNLAAAKEIILECGGAFVQLKDGSITIGGPGDLFLKTITVQKKGKASRNQPLDLNHPALSGLPITPLTFLTGASTASRAAIPASVPYSLFADSTLVKQGVMDDTGMIQVHHHCTTQQYTIKLANGASYAIPVAEQYAGNADNGAFANGSLDFHEGQPDAGSRAVDRAEHRICCNQLFDPEEDA